MMRLIIDVYCTEEIASARKQLSLSIKYAKLVNTSKDRSFLLHYVWAGFGLKMPFMHK